jgi:hypothetical protein
MAPITFASLIFACVLGGALLGMVLRRFLPTHHFDTETRDLVKLGVGLIGTMSALVLGLLVASTKASYDTHRTELTQIAANTILLDRVLAHYGPEAAPARVALADAVQRMLAKPRPRSAAQSQVAATVVGGELMFDRIQELVPHSDAQRALQSQAVALAINLGQTRWLLFAQSGTSISMPFLVVVVFWLSVLSLSFGLFAPRNGTAIATLVVSALSVAAALYLVLELDQPFTGLMQLSDEPLRHALAVLGR